MKAAAVTSVFVLALILNVATACLSYQTRVKVNAWPHALNRKRSLKKLPLIMGWRIGFGEWVYGLPSCEASVFQKFVTLKILLI